MKEINVSTNKYPNKYTLVDDDDYERLNKYKWHCTAGSKDLYIERHISKKNEKNERVYMSNDIMACPKNMCVDHINHNTLDNRKDNLRICTRSQNQWNLGISKINTTGFKGVSYNKPLRKYQARIKKNYKLYHLGYYIESIDAGRAYDKAAKEMFGEFACINGV